VTIERGFVNCLAADHGCGSGLEQAFFVGIPVYETTIHFKNFQPIRFRQKSGRTSG